MKGTPPKGVLWCGIRATLVWTGAPLINVCRIEDLTAAWSVHLRPGCRDYSLSLSLCPLSRRHWHKEDLFSFIALIIHLVCWHNTKEDPIKTTMPVDCTLIKSRWELWRPLPMLGHVWAEADGGCEHARSSRPVRLAELQNSNFPTSITKVIWGKWYFIHEKGVSRNVNLML